MATVAGKIQSLTGGKFFVKDEQGNIKEVSLNDDIYENSSVYGDSSNPSSAKVEIILSDNDVVVLSQGQKQLIDASLIETAFGTEELFFTREGLEQTIAEHNAIADVESDLREAKFQNENDGNITDEETTEGEEEVEDEEDGEGGRFSARDGDITDIESDLRKKAWAITRTFNEAEKAKDLENLTKKDLGSNPSNPFEPTSPTNPRPTNPTRPSTDKPTSNENNNTGRPESEGPRPDEPTPERPVTPPVNPPVNPPVTPPTPQEENKLKVYAIIEGSKEIWESESGSYTVKLVDKDGNTVIPTKDTTVTVIFTNKTTQDADTDHTNNQEITVTIPAGSSTSNPFEVEAVDDYLADDGEIFNLEIKNVDDQGQFENVAIGDINGNNKDVDTVIRDNSNPSNPGKEPDNPETDGNNPGYGPEDTVYVRLSQDATTQEYEGAKLTHKITLVDKDGTAVNLKAGETITVKLAYTDGTGINDDDFVSPRETIITITGNGGSEYTFTNVVKDDFYAEGTESYDVKIDSIVNQSRYFENVAIDETNNNATGTIIDNSTNPGNPGEPTDPNNPGTPENPNNPGFGPEDTVYAVIEGSKEIWESEKGSYTVKLVDKDGKEVIPTKDTVVTVVFTNKTTQDADTDHTNNQEITVTIPAGSSTSNPFEVEAKDDYLADDGEIFNLAIKDINDKGQFESVQIGDINGNNKDVDTLIKDNTNPTNPKGEPDNPETPGDNPGFGPEDTVYVKLINSGSVEEAAEGVTEFDPYTLKHYVQLVDHEGNPVEIPEGKSVTVVLEYKDIEGEIRPEDFKDGNIELVDGKYQWTVTFDSSTPTNANGIYEIEIKNPAIFDNITEGNEKYELTIGQITQSDQLFENVEKHPTEHTVTGVITDKPAVPVAITTPEDTVGYEYSFDTEETISKLYIQNETGKEFKEISSEESVDLFDNGKKIGTLTYYENNKKLIFTPEADYSNYAENDAIKFTYLAKVPSGNDEFKEVSIQVTPVADAPTITVNNVKTYEDASTWSELDTGNLAEGGNKIPLGLKVPSLSKDQTDKNGGAGDTPERNGEITLTFTNGSDLVLKDSSDNTISGSGAKLIYTTTENGSAVEKELLINSNNQTVQVVIVNTSGGTDINTNYHHSGTLPEKGGNVLYLTADEYQALKIQHAEDNDTNISIKIGVTSYELDDAGKPLFGNDDYSDKDNTALKSEATADMTVEILPVTDKITIVWDTAIVEGNTLGTITAKGEKADALFNFKTTTQQETTTIDLQSIMSNTSGTKSEDGHQGTGGDLDGSEERTYIIEGLPEGAVVTIGGQVSNPAGENGKVTIKLTDTNNKLEDHDFKIELPPYFYGKIEGKITLSVIDKGVEEKNNSSKWGATETDSIEFEYKVAGASFSIGNPVGIEDAGRENSNYKNNENEIGREPHNSNGNITDPTKGIALNVNPQYTLENNSKNEKITVNIAGLPKGSAIWIKDDTGADRLIGLDEDGKIYEYKQATSDPKEWTEKTEYTGDNGDNGITVTKSDDGDSYSIKVVDYKNVPTLNESGNITDYNYPVFIPPHNASTDSSSTSSKYQFDISGSITYKNGENGGVEKTLTFTDSNGSHTFPTHVEVAARADEPINTEIIDDPDTSDKVVYLKEKSSVGEDGIKYEVADKDTGTKYIKAVEDTKFDLIDIYKNTPSSYDTDGSEKLSIKVTLPSDKYTLTGDGITQTENTYTFDVSNLGSIKLGFPANVSGVSDKITLQYITTEYSGDSKTHFKEEIQFFIEAATDGVNVADGSTIYEDNQGHLYKDGENTKNKINIQATSQDTDGSETITSVKIKVDSIPTGYELYLDETMNTNIKSLTPEDGYYVLTPDQAKSIYGKNSAEHKLDGNFNLNVVYDVKDTDGLNTKTSSVAKDHKVTVKAITDAPTLAVTEIAAGANNTVDNINKEHGNPVVTVNEAGIFTIKINTSSDDKDGSEKVEEVELRGVPDGVEIEGAEWLYQTAGNNNVWVINGENITSRDQTIYGDGSIMDIVFAIGNPSFVTQDITIITKTRDGDDYREEATQKVQLKSTIKQGDGEGLGTPVIIDLAFKEGAKIYEDNDSDPVTNGKQNEYFIGHSITVAPQNSDGTAGGKWTVTITDLPTGVTLSGADYSYVDGGETYYVISGTYEAGQSGTAVSNTIQNKLDSIKVNLPADKNSGQDTDSGKFLEMKFTATIQNESSGRYNEGTSIADTNTTPILPVTDKMTIAIGINNINEDSEKVPLNITLTNPNDGNKTELVGNKLYIKVTETWKDVDVPGGAPGKLEVDETKYTVELKDGYYEITPKKADKFTVGDPITGIYYTPAEDRAGNVKFEVKTENIETGSTVTYDSSATKDITVKATWDTELANLSVVGNSTEDTPASAGGVTLKNAVKLDITSTSTSTDTSEKYTKITLDGIPNGLTVYYKDASEKLVSANNIGSTTTGGAYTLNPNKSDSVTGRNGWEVPVSNGVLPEIYVSAPENWAGEFTFTTKLTMSEYGLSDKTFDITDSKVTIDSVADGLQAGSATAQSDTAIFVYRTLNLNAQMKDVDGSEVLNLRIEGLSSEANFQLTSGENIPYSNTFEDGVWTIKGIKQEHMDKIQFVDFNASSGAIKVKATTQEIDSEGKLIADKESNVHDFGAIGNIGVSENNTISDNFTFTGEDLDFSKIDNLNTKFNNVGTIDLSHANASSIKLSLQDVLNLADDKKDNLIIKGNGDDKVTLTGEGWKDTTTKDGTYTIYSSTDDSVKVKVENTITDQGIII